MALIFQTDKNSPYSVEIAGVGILGGSAKGGIPVERAALTVQELQDDKGKPLTGATLEKAAEEFAEARGLSTKSYKNLDEEKLRVESGAFPMGKSIEEISREMSERDRAYYEADSAIRETAELPVQETSVLPNLSLPKEA